MQQIFLSLLLHFVIAVAHMPQQTAPAPPAVGEKAADFSLSSINGNRVRLSQVIAKSPVVLIVLRGYPGYQCPYCNLQVQDFLKKSQAFAAAGTHVILVYPGPPDNLAARATELMADKKLPDRFDLLLDPGYDFTNLYGLRWEAPQETAYPATFLIDQQGVVFFSKISKTHGGRTTAADVLDILLKKKAG